MRNNNMERTILKTLRAGLDSIEELTQELKNQEQEPAKSSFKIDLDPSIRGGHNETRRDY